MKSLQKYLFDALEATIALEKIADELTMSNMEDIYTRWTLERGLSIIGEALYQANKIRKDLPITNLKNIIATRHIIIHDYDVVDRIQIFVIIKKYLSVLKKEVEEILKSLEE